MSVKVKTPTGTVHYFDATHQPQEVMTETASPVVQPDRKASRKK